MHDPAPSQAISPSDQAARAWSGVGTFMRSGVASAVAVQLEYGVYLLLAIHAGVHYLAASVASSAAGIAIGFGANKYWAFRRGGTLLRHLRGYLVTVGIGIVIGLGALFVAVEVIGISYPVGRVLADIGVFLAWMYPASLVIYAARPGDPDYRERVRSVYEGLASTYYSASGPLSAIWTRMAERQVRSVISCVGPLNGGSALDVGCGSGTYARELSARGVAVTAIDIAPAMMEKARPFVREAHIGDLETISLGTTFDVVLCIGVLDFVADVQRTITNLAAHVAPGGRLVVLVPVLTPSVLGYFASQLRRGIFINLFRPRALDRVARAAGLTLLGIVRPLPYNAVLAWTKS